MLSGRDIVLLSSIDWEPLWQSHQEIATRFAAAGNRVLFVENTGVRAPRLRDARRLARRLRAWLDPLRRGQREVQQRLFVHSPVVLPPFGSRLGRTLNRAVLLRLIRRRVTRLGFRDPIVWTWLPTDTALDLADALKLPDRTLVYFCIADFEQLAGRPERLRVFEPELLKRCDVVFAHSELTRAKCARFAARVELVPPSVNISRFPVAPVRPDVSKSPVVGYVGGVHRFVDVELVAACARARPEWRWHLIGPVQTDVRLLEQLANVELLGPRPHEQLGELIAAFDACVIPYRTSADARSVAPTKLNEYLAVGRPVAATDLPWVVDFECRHGVVEVAPARAEAFNEAVTRALASASDPAASARRRKVAMQSGWDERLERISDVLEQVIDERQPRDSAAIVPTNDP